MHKMLLDLPAQIETERLILRPYRAGDGPAYHEVCMRNKKHLMPFEEGNPALDVNTVEDAEILMRRFAADWVSRSVFFLGAWEKASGAFAAQMYVGVVSWELPEFEVGYWADERQEGRGFVTEGAKAALRFCFEALGRPPRSAGVQRAERPKLARRRALRLRPRGAHQAEQEEAQACRWNLQRRLPLRYAARRIRSALSTPLRQLTRA